ncbi:SDR family NAD(P)-dependent oxidoreductase [Levilactobacillus bambusae]|uniref:Oxidoreductase n=1 Tax=Levilactobacillus bambusae TaxID=2024736 RepID=A0A2V1MZE6_9LACO|nr:SDR family NAD(P)-dependent oxidoreductase [Levilactobacillus bambusae]PWG00394.1 oxidoreductase [Levilactobacillus bambusae]
MSINPQQHPIQSPFNQTSTAKQVMAGIDLAGKSVVITGGYSGLGLVTTKALLSAGAAVTVLAHSVTKAQRALKPDPRLSFAQVDLMSPSSIANFANQYLQRHSSVDLLIEDAGIMFAPLMRDSRGNEGHLSTNYLGHFQLATALMPALAAANGRIVILTSRAAAWNGVDFDDPNFNQRPYDDHVAYAQSKTADILLAVELDRRYQNQGVRAYAVHPGLVPGTGLGRFVTHSKTVSNVSAFIMNNLQATRLINLRNHWSAHRHHQTEFDYFKTVQQGAASTLWAATSPLLSTIGGVFIEDCNVGTVVPADSKSIYGVRPWAVESQLSARLWPLGEELIHRPVKKR